MSHEAAVRIVAGAFASTTAAVVVYVAGGPVWAVLGFGLVSYWVVSRA